MCFKNQTNAKGFYTEALDYSSFMLSFENCPYPLTKLSLLNTSLYLRAHCFLVSKLALHFDGIRCFKVKVKRIGNIILLIELIILVVTCVPLLWLCLLVLLPCLFETIQVHGAVDQHGQLQPSI